MEETHLEETEAAMDHSNVRLTFKQYLRSVLPAVPDPSSSQRKTATSESANLELYVLKRSICYRSSLFGDVN
jgi:hypothetical protein